MVIVQRYRVLILEFDATPQPIVRVRGTWGDIFEQFMRDGLDRYRQQNPTDSKIRLEVIRSNVLEMEPLPGKDEIDCVLVSGSNEHDASGDSAWTLRVVEYLRDLYSNSNVALIGFCFGHQLIGRALGMQPRRNPNGWELSLCDVSLGEVGSKLFGRDTLPLHLLHRDMLPASAPPGVELLGGSDLCPNQGLYVPGRLLTLQAHPEFDAFVMNYALNWRCERELIGRDQWRRGLDVCGLEHAGGLVSEVVWRVLLGVDC
ncbi:unnamed protein product [Clonostachys byssicola]|uniref:Glutamine amidotransferase domain-containing protein n=1 Tax=Clonostachys byssicola TaxID=160290 RepID=A0A9N9XYU6_9HYPO|nr:unnamed protein product [Clonostachys byssicola]